MQGKRAARSGGIADEKELFAVTGMTCSACSGRVQRAVAALDGVRDANVNLLKNTMAVSFDEAMTSPDAIVAAVTSAGYGASVRGERRDARAEKTMLSLRKPGACRRG